MTVSIDDLAATVTAMSAQIATLLAAVNVQKSYIDAASQIAVSGITGSSGSPTPAVGKSPVGDSTGKFSISWVQNAADLSAYSNTFAGKVK